MIGIDFFCIHKYRMSSQVYVGVIVLLFIILLIGWSKSLFAFVVGGVAGIIGVRLYDSEILSNLANVSSANGELYITGVYSSFPVTLMERSGKSIRIKNIAETPHEKDLPEYPIGVNIPCYSPDKVRGVPLNIILTRKMRSDKNMLIVNNNQTSLKGRYFLELAPAYTKRDLYQNIEGVYALKADDTDPKKANNSQKTEQHSQLLEKLAKLLNMIWCGNVPKGVRLLGASKHSATIPDQGPIALFRSDTKQAEMHMLTQEDFLKDGYRYLERGEITIKYDDQKIKMPVVQKEDPSKSDVKRMPLMLKISEIAEDRGTELLIVLQDYITGAITKADVLPQNVIYIGQALRLDPDGKLYLNAFINTKAYDSILRKLDKFIAL